MARVKELYNNGVTDEFIPPFTVVDAAGQPVGPIHDNDVVMNFNYRRGPRAADYAGAGAELAD